MIKFEHTDGEEAQIIVAIEELSELQKELTKALRGKPNRDALAEEIADVIIMVEQLKIMFPYIEDDIIDWQKRKLERIEALCEETEVDILTNVNDRS